jgi:hypothetical protein
MDFSILKSVVFRGGRSVGIFIAGEKKKGLYGDLFTRSGKGGMQKEWGQKKCMRNTAKE